MAEKTIKGRIVQKHDIEANWSRANNFIPMKGEMIIYDIDENYSYERVKIGDGVTVVSALPFITNIYTQSTAPTNATVGSLWIDTSEVGIVAAEGVGF